MFTHVFGRYNRGLRAEFLPSWVCYISVRIYCFFKMFNLKTPLWFTATNPGFPLGGLYPSSKRDILKQLPEARVPKGFVIHPENFTKNHIKKRIEEGNYTFPLIIKPDNGVRGLAIKIFHTVEEFDQSITTYIQKEQRWGSRLLQEFIEDPLEIGVFYIQDPKTKQGRITGLVEKEFLHIIGDGKRSYEELIHAHPRAKFHIDLLKKEHRKERKSIPYVGEVKDIVEIGSHSRGSTFIDISEQITPELISLFEKISSEIDGFHYGRYDIRTKSINALLAGKFKIIEVNPTYGEPTRMYDPRYNFIQQQKILLYHWSLMYSIAKNNNRQGIPFATYTERKAAKKEYQKLGV